jgi:hypothetical protein
VTAILLAVTGVVLGAGSPAFAEPHADRKYCETRNDALSFESFRNPIGPPYTSFRGVPTPSQGFWDSGQAELWSGGLHAITFGRAYLKAGDYFSIDSTWDRVPVSGHYEQLTTADVARHLEQPDFTWHYCEKIYMDDPADGRTNTAYDRAPADGWYRTAWILGAHRGVRLCVTRPLPDLPHKARCVGDNGTKGWYVDNDDEDPRGSNQSPGDPGDPGSPDGGGGSTSDGTQTPTITTMQANTGLLFSRDTNGAWHDMQLGMMRGTSPATSNGQIAFQANTGTLFTRPVGGPVRDTGYGMMAGTNPSISGGQIAFQANNSLLHTRNLSTGATTDLRLGMMAGSSPSIAGNTGSWRIAFQANDGFLYYRESGGATVNTGYGMMRGTSPSITKLSNGTYVIAFQANTGLLYSYINGGATDLRLGLMTDTSPSIASVGTAWTIAFQANTGFLFTRNSAGTTVDTRYGMMARTSPSARGNRILFQANTGLLFSRDGSAAAVDTRYGMMAGTNPGV